MAMKGISPFACSQGVDTVGHGAGEVMIGLLLLFDLGLESKYLVTGTDAVPSAAAFSDRPVMCWSKSQDGSQCVVWGCGCGSGAAATWRRRICADSDAGAEVGGGDAGEAAGGGAEDSALRQRDVISEFCVTVYKEQCG